nr:T9SS type A sorting domain-containing protein [uncultured Fluviicola sp.]
MKRNITFLLSLVCCVTLNAQLISSTGSMSAQRVSHGSATLANGKILVFGGDNGNVNSYVVHKTAELYNGGTWSATGSMAKNRRVPASVVLSNGNVLVMGGRDADQNEFASCEIYNVATGTWSYADSMAEARSASKAITLNNGKVLVVGGDYTGTCELYDQATNTWSTTGSLNTDPNGWFDAVKLPNGNVLIVGGGTAAAEIYNVATGTWTPTANPMTLSRTAPTAILMTNGKVLVAGGNFTKTSEVFDPVANTFTAAGDMGQYASACDMVNLTDGSVLIYGIGDLFSTDRKALQQFNPSTNTWGYPGTTPVNIITANDYTVNRLPNGKILYSGGNVTTGNGSNNQCYVVNLNALGLEDLQAVDQFMVYPVPAKDYITVVSENGIIGTGYNLLLSNTLGQVIYTAPINNQETSINLQGITQSGIYFINLKNNRGEIVQTSKIIVE